MTIDLHQWNLLSCKTKTQAYQSIIFMKKASWLPASYGTLQTDYHHLF